MVLTRFLALTGCGILLNYGGQYACVHVLELTMAQGHYTRGRYRHF